MIKEIERKFLVRETRLPSCLLEDEGQTIEQGYLSSKPSVRIRVTKRLAWITVKGPGKISRSEYEYVIPIQDGRELLELCKHRLVKIRRKIKFGKHVWEVDQFLNNLDGLWLAEVELQHEHEEIIIPDWIGMEVSLDSRYANSKLARSQKIPRRVS